MSRARPWIEDPRFDHPGTRCDTYSNAAGQTVVIRFPDGATRKWSRDCLPGEAGGDWQEISEESPVTASPELPAPAESLAALDDLAGGAYDLDHADRHVRAIAGPVVAAELRRLADRYAGFAEETTGSMTHTYGGVADELRSRADELDPR